MTSSDIQNTVLFCVGNFQACAIFRRKCVMQPNT
jgi:hypothetical protein